MSVGDHEAHRHAYVTLRVVDWCHYREIVERCTICLHERHVEADRDPLDYGTFAFLRSEDCTRCRELVALRGAASTTGHL